MKIIDVQQGSAEWFRARMGIPTASAFDQIITPKTGKLSASSRKYAYRLIAERLLNSPAETLEGVRWMEHGKEQEPNAVKQYEWVNEVETVPVGFITTDDGRFGASPDRLLKAKPIALEIKCPAPHTHIGYLVDGHGDAYRPQVQGQLFVTDFEFADFYSYHPRMPAMAIRTPRDEPFLRLLRDALEAFDDEFKAMLERAKSFGVFQAYEEARTPADVALADEVRDGYAGEEGSDARDAFGLSPVRR